MQVGAALLSGGLGLVKGLVQVLQKPGAVIDLGQRVNGDPALLDIDEHLHQRNSAAHAQNGKARVERVLPHTNASAGWPRFPASRTAYPGR